MRRLRNMLPAIGMETCPPLSLYTLYHMSTGRCIRNEADARAARAFEAFAVTGTPAELERIAVGRIHATFLAARTEAGHVDRYILQRINTHVFREPERMMENIRRVTEHLRLKLTEEGKESLGRRVLTLYPTKEGQTCWRDADGHWWRLYGYVENTRSSTE